MKHQWEDKHYNGMDLQDVTKECKVCGKYYDPDDEYDKLCCRDLDEECPPKTVYVAFINLSGLYSRRPIVMRWDNETGYWYDREGDLDASKLGLESSDGYIKLVSEDKREVELWLEGAKAVLSMIHKWSK